MCESRYVCLVGGCLLSKADEAECGFSVDGARAESFAGVGEKA